MIRHKLPNLLLKSLLNFLIKLFLVFSQHFNVNFEPSEKIDNSYSSLNKLEDPLPVIENKDYRELLAQAEKNGQPIKPVRRIKPLNVDVEKCSTCGAPKEYLGLFGRDSDGYQKVQCKVCKHQWAPEKPVQPKAHPTYRCPYCNYALSKEKRRKHFTKYKCKNNECSKWVKHGKRYRFRAFDFEPDELQSSTPEKAPVNLANSHYGSFIIAKAVDFYISLGLSLRQTVRAIKQTWQVSVSRESIQKWTVSLAFKLAPLIAKLPLPLSGTVAIDETYIKVKGKWHYLFTAIDAKRGFIIAQHLSKNRDAKAALTILKTIIERYDGSNFTLVSDKAPIYDVAVHASRAFLNASIDHKQIKGLFPDDQANDIVEAYRPYKNTIERLFGTYKAHYKRHKSFSSYDGALSHAILFQLYFNYLKPHSSFNDQPPLQIQDKSGQPVETWAQLIRWILTQTD